MKFMNVECEVKRTQYEDNGNLAVMLFDKETKNLFSVATVNTAMQLPPNVTVVKDYSENSGMRRALEEAGLAKQIGTTPLSSFVQDAPIMEFDLDKIGKME